MTHQVKRLLSDAVASRQRRVFVMAGSEAWACDIASGLLAELKPEAGLWIGSCSGHQLQIDDCKGVMAITFNQAKQWLGRETDSLIINTWSGFDVNGFGAMSGTLKAGGLLLFIVPPLSDWPDYPDPEYKRIAVYPEKTEELTGRYLKRLVDLIKGSPDISLLEEQGSARFQDRVAEPVKEYEGFAEGCKTAAQIEAVAAVKRVAKGHRRRPLVLTADRGRGKSAALGIGAAALIREGVKRVLVTAPARSATDVLFKHASTTLGVELDKPGSLIWEECQLQFKAPDELTAHHDVCDLLLVDEAAAIPVPLLKALLEDYTRIVFSSTIHGYEGAGRGFSVRFRATLDQLTPQWKGLHLSEPVRWTENDPLERFTFDSLLLNASPVEAKALNGIDWRQGIIEKLDRDELVANRQLLSELFGLLVLAHYKTTPMDLRHLLDGSNIAVYALKLNGHILATALVAREGHIEESLVNDIWLGKRRVRGHVLPQSLSNHVGIAEAVRLQGARIIRIAVHPGWQQEGIGQQLMAAISTELADEGVDYIGSLFGATPELVDFWGKAAFDPVRIGLTREAASGSHAVMMLKPLTAAGLIMVKEGRQRFAEQLPYLLGEGLQDLDADIVLRLLRHRLSGSSGDLTDAEWTDIQSFANGQRLYENCIVGIKKLVLTVLSGERREGWWANPDRELLVCKVLQNKSWPDVAAYACVPGRSQAITRVRSVLACLLSDPHCKGLFKDDMILVKSGL